MPLYFAYGSNMDVEAMGRRCPRSKPRRPCPARTPSARDHARGVADRGSRAARGGSRTPLGPGARRRSGPRPLRGRPQRALRQGRSARHRGGRARSGRWSISAPMPGLASRRRTTSPASWPRPAPPACRPKGWRRSMRCAPVTARAERGYRPGARLQVLRHARTLAPTASRSDSRACVSSPPSISRR